MVAAVASNVPNDTYSTVQLASSTLSLVEKIQFNSLAIEKLRVTVGSCGADHRSHRRRR